MSTNRDRDQDLEREVRAHLELEAEELRGTGLRPDEAFYAARRAFGNTTLIQEEVRRMWGMNWLDTLSQDLRYACRAMQKSPGFSAVAVLIAALGIGTNTSIFSVVDAVLLHPLPYAHADRLVTPINIGKQTLGTVVADFQYGAWRDQGAVFDGIAAYTARQFTVTSPGEPELLKAQAVTPGFLHTLGVAPILGRDFASEDAAPRGGQVVLLTYQIWMRRFGGDPSILSRQVTLDGKLYSIAGVLPRNFEFPGNTSVSLLIGFSEPPAQPGNGVYFYNIIARLRDGVSIARAESDLRVVNQRIEATYLKRLGANSSPQTNVVGLHDRLVGNVRPALLILTGAVGLVLLIVCVNLCNLLMARAISRQREIAVRLALGAGRARVVRQLLTEGMLLAALGGLAGLALAFGGIRLLRAIAPADVPHVDDAHIGSTVLLFNLGIAALAGVLFGLAPARGASGIDPEAVLKQTTRAATGSRKQRSLEGFLIITETALALILLAGAGLLIRTFASLTTISPGFQPDHVLTARLTMPFWKYRRAPERRRAFVDALIETARTAPGVDAAGVVASVPYGGFVLSSSLEIEGQPKPPDDPSASNVAANFAAGDYFRAMGIPILEGRAIDSTDGAGRPPVVVVSELLARRYFPDGHAVGSHVRLGGVSEWVEVVGIYGTIRQGGLASEPRAEMFFPAAQAENGASAQTLVLRSTADPRALATWLRPKIAQLDPDMPPPELETMRAYMSSLMSSQVFVMRLLALFAALAILLAAIGIYSVLAYSVERRSHEIGIRLALGAKDSHIFGLVLGRGVRLSVAGALIGVAGSLALTRYLKSLLYGVTPHDPATIAAGCGLVVLAAFVASYLPARRAVHHDAMTTLRQD